MVTRTFHAFYQYLYISFLVPFLLPCRSHPGFNTKSQGVGGVMGDRQKRKNETETRDALFTFLICGGTLIVLAVLALNSGLL